MQSFKTKVSSVILLNGPVLSISSIQRLADTLSLSMEFAAYSSETVRAYGKSGKDLFVVELSENLSAPMSIDQDSGIWICGNMMENLCRYLKIKPESYLLLMVLLAVTQINALRNNELMKSEYLIHESGCTCLFSRFTDFMAWLGSFEELFICKGSLEFYKCIGNEYEIGCLQTLIEHMNRTIQKA